MNTEAPTLQHLAQIAGARVVNPPADDTQIASISLDSTAIEPGGLFAALPGTRVHGASFAEGSQAGAMLTDAAGLDIIAATGDERPVLVVEDVRAVLGEVSAEVYGWPSKSMLLSA